VQTKTAMGPEYPARDSGTYHAHQWAYWLHGRVDLWRAGTD